MTLQETMLIPFSQLLDMIAIEQIKSEGFLYVRTEQEDLDDVMDMLRLR